MKRFLLWTTGVLLVIAAALAIVLSQIDTAFVVRQIADATAKATGKPLVFENAPRISFFPPGVRFGQARWGQSDQGDSLAISVKGGMAELEFMPLLSGTMVVREVRLDNPVVRMRQGEAASAAAAKVAEVASGENQSDVAAPAATDTPETTPKASPKATTEDAAKAVAASPNQTAASTQTPAIELKRLVVRQGSLHFTDDQGQTLDLSDLNLSVENLRPGQEAVAQCDFTFTASLVDKEKGSKAKASTPLSGNLALSAKLRYAPPQLALRQTSLTLSPLTGPLPKEAGPIQLNIEGNADLNTLSMHVAKCWLTTPQARLGLQGEASFSPVAFTGNLELDGSLRKLAALAGQTLKPAPKGISDGIKIKSRLAYGNNSLNLSDISARVDDVDLRGQLRLGMEPKAPLSITAEAQVSAINLDNYLPLPENGKSQAASEPKDKKTAEDASPLPDINVRAAVAGIRQGKLQIKDVQVIAQGLRGNYKISTFNCVLGSGGTVRASGAANIPVSAYAVNGTASDVNVGALLESLGKGRPVNGSARLDVDLTMSGKNATALQNSLAGKGELEVRQMHLESMPTLPANVPGITGKPLPDTFDLVRVPFTARNGEINASPITVSSSGLNARGQARISLPRQNVDATANVETLGMTVPVIVKGPFSNISYSVDPRFALDMAKKLPGLLQDTGKNAGDSAKGAGTLLQNGARGAEGLVRGLFGK